MPSRPHSEAQGPQRRRQRDLLRRQPGRVAGVAGRHLSGAARVTADLAWIGLYRPDQRELASLAQEFDLHELAVEDAIQAHQRPKLERYGDTLFVVLKAARYRDATEEVEFGEVHVFVGPDFVVTVRHAEAPNLAAVRRRVERDPELLGRGTEAVLYAIMDTVVDGYAPVVAGLENDIDEIETEVFRGDPKVSRRIYELSREVIEFQRATRPLIGMLELAARRLREVRHGRGTAALSARRGRPRHPGGGEGRRVPRTAARHPDGERDAGRPAAERGDEEPRDRQQRRRTKR